MKLLLLVAMCVFVAEAAVKPVFDKTADEVVAPAEDTSIMESERQAKALSTGRTFTEWGRSVMDFFGFGDYDYDYDYFSFVDNDIGFSEHGSSYVSYQPARDDTYDYQEESTWGDTMMNVAMAVVPLGLLLSAIPTGVFTFALRRRSLDDPTWTNEIPIDTSSLPLLRAIETQDILEVLPELTTRSCQEKLFCELSRLGQDESSSYMQKAFYYASTLTPKFVSRRLGLGKLFEISKSGHCEALYCSATRRDALEATQYISNNLELPEVTNSENE